MENNNEKGKESELNNNLINACMKGDLSKVKSLLEHGANIHANEDKPLSMESVLRRIEVVKILIEHGANLHMNDDKSLSMAARNGHSEALKLLWNTMLNMWKN